LEPGPSPFDRLHSQTATTGWTDETSAKDRGLQKEHTSIYCV
jgi:hypothetical protein